MMMYARSEGTHDQKASIDKYYARPACAHGHNAPVTNTNTSNTEAPYIECFARQGGSHSQEAPVVTNFHSAQSGGSRSHKESVIANLTQPGGSRSQNEPITNFHSARPGASRSQDAPVTTNFYSTRQGGSRSQEMSVITNYARPECALGHNAPGTDIDMTNLEAPIIECYARLEGTHSHEAPVTDYYARLEGTHSHNAPVIDTQHENTNRATQNSNVIVLTQYGITDRDTHKQTASNSECLNQGESIEFVQQELLNTKCAPERAGISIVGRQKDLNQVNLAPGENETTGKRKIENSKRKAQRKRREIRRKMK